MGKKESNPEEVSEGNSSFQPPLTPSSFSTVLSIIKKDAFVAKKISGDGILQMIARGNLY